jgi:hypothetical protein
MIDHILTELQTGLVTLASAAVTALCVYVITWLRDYLGIKKSDANEEAIRRAATTEAGVLIQTGAIGDPDKLAQAVAKVVDDLRPQVKAEGYDGSDIADMIIGAAGLVFPPANLLKLFVK